MASLTSSTLAWIALAAAGVLEIVWAAAMKQSQGFTKLTPTTVALVGMIASVVLLSYAMRTLPLGTAYTIWTGIGAVGAFAFGIFVLGEQASVTRIAAAALIVSGLVLMKLTTTE